jgi:hypothetical protein
MVHLAPYEDAMKSFNSVRTESVLDKLKQFEAFGNSTFVLKEMESDPRSS